MKNRMEAVILDLDRDTTIEIASGVAQLNSVMEKVQGNLSNLRIGEQQVTLANIPRWSITNHCTTIE